jgi:putative membrane-bound dehydrogenase-like protein
MRFRTTTSIIVWVLVALVASGQGDDAKPDGDRPDPTSPDARLTIERFAADPQIVTPTGIAVEANGRVLVIESHTHFRPEDYAGPKADRILAMTDTDGDGRADKITVFFEGTQATMNLAVYEDGSVLVATRMEVFRLFDEDGDGQADKNTPIVRMETKGNYPHNGLSGFAFDGLGNVYFGLGENLGADYQLIGTDGAKLSGGGEGGSIYRCSPDGSKLTRFATGFWNPFHLCFDAYDRLFAVDNDPDSRPPCRLLHIVEWGDYGYRFRNGRKGIHPFTAWNGELPGTLPMTAGTGEAPSGVLAYDSDLLPAEYRGALLATSWGDHRIERFRLQPRGASFRAVAESIYSGGENFRPVGIALAPNGSLFVSDWVDKSYTLHGKGAVWQIGAKGATPAARSKDLHEAALSIDRPTRQRAIRRMFEHKIRNAETLGNVAFLNEVAVSSRPPEVRADALIGLARFASCNVAAKKLVEDKSNPGLQALAVRLMDDDQALFARLTDKSLPQNTPPEARAEAVRRLKAPENEALLLSALADADPFIRSAAHSALMASSKVGDQIRWAGSDDAAMRLGALLLLRESKDTKAQTPLAKLLRDEDPLVRFAAVQWVAEAKLEAYREQIVAGLGAGATTRQLFEACLAALERLDGSIHGSKDESSGDQYVLRLAQDPKTVPAVRARAIRSLSPDNPALTTEMLLKLVDADDLATRLEAVRSLRQKPDDKARDRLAQLALDAQAPEVLRAEAIVGVSPDSPARRDLLLTLATGKPSTLRREALRSLRGVELTDDERGRLSAAPAEGMEAELIGRLLGKPPVQPGPGRQEIDAWSKLLEKAGDAAAGERIYFHPRGPGCYRCHSIDGRGGAIGPDLSTTARTLAPRRLLESLLDPSKEVAPQFSLWNVSRTDGTTLSGILLGEQPDGSRQYGLLQGEVVTLKPADVAETHAARGSIMPEDLLAQLTPGEFFDLMAYLRTPR